MKSKLALSLLVMLACLVAAAAGPTTKLARLTRGLTFTTLTENPVRPFRVNKSDAARFLKRVEDVNAQTCWPSVTFDEQAASILDEVGDIDNAPSFRRIKRLLDYMKSNLSDLRVAYFGNEPAWDIHVFGKDRQGNLVGFHYIEVV